ncbi:protein phosphatase 1K, mitochondrial [Cynoglossus semilaevis]|uniref:protein phosphatase 1K, mitochondrial n=1 Tax=Cynoglossus semilaevis TaxID=244447 RepID=UPI000D62BF80|nr:protein phosphatase 1K, mitochondrial-like [Cynoglossus semilaevis]
MLSSTTLLNVLRRSCSAVTSHTVLNAGWLPEPAAASGQVRAARLGGVRQASGSVSLDFIIRDRLVSWESLGIWDNRIEDPIVLPSSVINGTPIPQSQVNLSLVGCSSVLGLRKQNEDRLRVARLQDNLLYFAVFDGHGGPHAADFCYTFMEKFIRDALEKEDNLEKVLKKAFVDVDKGLHTHLSYFNTASVLSAGTTATVAVLRDGVELVVGSVGDSRAVLCRKGGAKKLTTDHTPEQKDERHRIYSAGGFVTWNSVGQANVNGRLAMTRSIGDFHLKNSGVIAEPDTQRVLIQQTNDSFLALTTDGINFMLSDQEVCDVINQCHDASEAADVITQQALQYGSEDNASIIVVPLGAWGKQTSSVDVYSVSRNLVSSGRWA